MGRVSFISRLDSLISFSLRSESIFIILSMINEHVFSMCISPTHPSFLLCCLFPSSSSERTRKQKALFHHFTPPSSSFWMQNGSSFSLRPSLIRLSIKINQIGKKESVHRMSENTFCCVLLFPFLCSLGFTLSFSPLANETGQAQIFGRKKGDRFLRQKTHLSESSRRRKELMASHLGDGRHLGFNSVMSLHTWCLAN